MNDSWTCLMVENGPGLISDNIRTELKIVSCIMATRKIERHKINGGHCSGIMTTDYESHLVGTRSGILFRSQLDGNNGEDYFVNFLFSEEDLKQGERILRKAQEVQNSTNWVSGEGRIPVEQLYKFYDLRKTGVH